jgi:hypothetical protein
VSGVAHVISTGAKQSGEIHSTFSDCSFVYLRRL